MLLSFIPGISYLTTLYTKAFQWLVFRFNDWFLHVRSTLNLEGYGSGDTSFAWAEFYTILIISLLLALVWRFIDKKRQESPTLTYWILTLIRYNTAMVAFSYGFIKLYALQMPFPTLSQLATPIGDFLPMRLCWLHIGYSVPYQTFSGIMEILVGFLLLYRRTVTLGLLLGLGVFTNVFALNLCYDIPVKLFSMQLMIGCLFLVVWDGKSFIDFFVLNKPTTPINSYDFTYGKKWQIRGRYILKFIFIVAGVCASYYQAWGWHQEELTVSKGLIKQGVYRIKTYKKNNQILPLTANDTLVWKDFIFDKGGNGSINTRDTLFDFKYGRGYFAYTTDKKKHAIAFKISQADSTNLFVMRYKVLDTKTIQLQGAVRKDTLFFELVRNDKTFPLAERQFHWISEANR
jgi:hypothetical protein